MVPPTTPSPMTTAIQKNGLVRSRIWLAYGPFGCSAFCLLSGPVLSPHPASAAAAVATAATVAARRNRWVRSNISLSSAFRREFGGTLQRSFLGPTTLSRAPRAVVAPLVHKRFFTVRGGRVRRRGAANRARP